MLIYINDDFSGLIAELAKQRGITEQEAVRLAVTAELERGRPTIPLRERFAALRAAQHLPPQTGLATDKMFFDELSSYHSTPTATPELEPVPRSNLYESIRARLAPFGGIDLPELPRAPIPEPSSFED